MKPTQVTELFANIKKTFVSFFSILMFVALGVGIFVGIRWAAPALQNAADEVYNDQSFHNIQIIYPYGLTDEDLEELASIEGVSAVEGVRQSKQVYSHDGIEYNVQVRTEGQDINVLRVIDGKLPFAPGQIALEAQAAEQLGLHVGDTITFEADGDSGTSMKFLNHRTFRITALVESPEYVAKSQLSVTPRSPDATSFYTWVCPEEFKADAFYDGYPIVNIRCDSLDGLNTFTKKYTKASSEIVERVEAYGATQANERYAAIHDDAQARIDDAQKQLDDAKKELEEGKKKISDGEKELADARQQLADARQQVADGEQQLSDAYDELVSSQRKIDDGWAQLNEKKAELSRYQADYDSACAALAAVQSEVDGLRAVLDEESAYKQQVDAELDATIDDLTEQFNRGEITEEELDQGIIEAQEVADEKYAESDARIDAKCDEVSAAFTEATGEELPFKLDHTTADVVVPEVEEILAGARDIPVEVDGREITLNQAEAELADGWAQARSAENELNAAQQKVNAGWDEYYAGQQRLEEARQQIADGEKQIAEGEKELADARKQVAEGEKQVAEGEKEIQDARDALASAREMEWTVAPRSYNASEVEIDRFGGMTSRLSLSMALLFVIVGLLVSYSAMSRIVHEQIVETGTKKALGLRDREVMISPMLYATFAVLAGAIVGLIVGTLLVEGIINGVMADRFIIGTYPRHFGIILAIAATLLELAIILVTTYLAIRGILKRQAVELLRGEEPPKAKTRFYEKWKIWDRASVLTQTMVNNCFNDKRRVFSTLIGVAGCTALVVTAMTLNNKVMQSPQDQYDHIYLFNAVAYPDADVENSADDLEKALERQGATVGAVDCQQVTFKEPSGSLAVARLIVPTDDNAFEQVYQINPDKKRQVFSLEGDGIWVNHAFAEHLGYEVGDEIEVITLEGEAFTVPIEGFFEYHLVSFEIIMGEDTYNRLTGNEAEANTLFVNTNDRPVQDFVDELQDLPAYKMMIDDKGLLMADFDSFAGLSRIVVLIYLVLAILMAIVVLLNLNVMFIEEKKRELIVLMINGFSVHDAKRYIYQDSIVLTIIGIILGIILGAIMGAISVNSVESEMASMSTGISWMAVLIGALVSGVLSIIMCVIALRRIPKFKLTDINKL